MAEDEEVKRQNCLASSSKSHKTKQIDASKKNRAKICTEHNKTVILHSHLMGRMMAG